jgi:hypothetical protein
MRRWPSQTSAIAPSKKHLVAPVEFVEVGLSSNFGAGLRGEVERLKAAIANAANGNDANASDHREKPSPLAKIFG